MLKNLRALIAVSTAVAGMTGPALARDSASLASVSQVMAELPVISAPIPQTDASHAFLSAKERMEAAGYVEEEYFISGHANVYDWVGSTRDLRVVSGPTSYVNRILVRRPKDPAKFSGNVELTILNATLAVDRGGPSDFNRMIANGDAWIGITSKALTAGALKRFDPVRYAPLNWHSPVPPAQRCERPTIIPLYTMGGEAGYDQMRKMGMNVSSADTEDGLVWDMLGQLGLLLKSDEGKHILPGTKTPRIFVTGISQSSLLIRTWINAFHNRYRTPEGKPVFDGYLSIVGPNMLRLNECSADVTLDDPRQKLLPPDVPFITLSSEGESWLTSHTYQPDVFTKTGGLVTYEVAGGTHRRIEVPGLEANPLAEPAAADGKKAGFTAVESTELNKLLASGLIMNDMPWAPIVRGAYHNLQEWAINGTQPPQAERIALDSNLNVIRDAYGNATGGVRMPYLEAPLATYRGAVGAGGPGAIFGVTRPWTAQELSKAYPEPETYLARFEKAAEKLVRERWISQADADAMIKHAREVQPSIAK